MLYGRPGKFQFLIVQLKVKRLRKQLYKEWFQFLIVQLKVRVLGRPFPLASVSIPYSTIKSTDNQDFLQQRQSFNSL